MRRRSYHRIAVAVYNRGILLEVGAISFFRSRPLVQTCRHGFTFTLLRPGVLYPDAGILPCEDFVAFRNKLAITIGLMESLYG